MALNLDPGRYVDLVGDDIAPRNDVELEVAAVLSLLDEEAAELGPRLSHSDEEPRKRRVPHPIAVLEAQKERLGVAAFALALNLHVLGVEVRSLHGHVDSELADVEEWLLAPQGVLVAAGEPAVVIQLDGADGLVLGELVARSHLNRFGAIVVLRFFDEFEDG